MRIFDFIFGEPEIRQLDTTKKQEVEKIVQELSRIGQKDDYLSLTPGGDYDIHCHHRRARDLGKRLHEIGGASLMIIVRKRIKRKHKDMLAEHLDHCWKGIGDWQL